MSLRTQKFTYSSVHTNTEIIKTYTFVICYSSINHIRLQLQAEQEDILANNSLSHKRLTTQHTCIEQEK